MGGPNSGQRPKHELNRQVVQLRREGLTQQEIAERFGLTHQRVQQICAAYLDPEDYPPHKPPLAVDTILQWADAHHARNGNWPIANSGPIRESPGDSWIAVDAALRRGSRGLPGSSSLARLLAAHRGVRNRNALPRLTVEEILRWADRFHERTGEWPVQLSGAIPELPGETWRHVDSALRRGIRGLAGGSSLCRLLRQHRGVPRWTGRRRTSRPGGIGGDSATD